MSRTSIDDMRVNIVGCLYPHSFLIEGYINNTFTIPYRRIVAEDNIYIKNNSIVINGKKDTFVINENDFDKVKFDFLHSKVTYDGHVIEKSIFENNDRVLDLDILSERKNFDELNTHILKIFNMNIKDMRNNPKVEGEIIYENKKFIYIVSTSYISCISKFGDKRNKILLNGDNFVIRENSVDYCMLYLPH